MLWLIPRLWLIVGVVALVVAGAGYIVWSIRKDAQSDLLRSIERTEDNARKQAVEGARGVDECWDRGWLWDRSTGACRIP